MRERSFCRRTCGLDAPTRYAATALLMVVLATADSGVQCSEGGREEGGGQGRQGWGLQKTRGREELSGRCRRCEEGGRRQATDWAGKASVRGSWPGGAGRGGRAGGLHLWEASGGAYGCEVCAVGGGLAFWSGGCKNNTAGGPGATRAAGSVERWGSVAMMVTLGAAGSWAGMRGTGNRGSGCRGSANRWWFDERGRMVPD